MQLPRLFDRGFVITNLNVISFADAVKPNSRVRISPQIQPMPVYPPRVSGSSEGFRFRSLAKNS